MADNATVDFSNVYLIFGGHRISGYMPGVGISLGGFSSVGSHVGVGTGVTLGERSHREEKAVVEFRDGRVHQFRMPAR